MGVMGIDEEEVKRGSREGFNAWLHNSYCLASITNVLVFVTDKICVLFEMGSNILYVI